MRHYLGFLTITAIAMLLTGLVAPPEKALSQMQEDRFLEASPLRTPAAPHFAQDRVLVKLRENAPGEALEAINRDKSARTDRKLPHTRVRVIKLPRGLPVEAALKIYRASPDVEYAEPDFILGPSLAPNDPGYRELHGLNNTGQTGGTADADIDAPEAWDITTGSPGTVVAVIDTGVDIDHPDLAGNLWSNTGETAGNNIDDDKNGYIDDVHGYDFANKDATVFDATSEDAHGTHVAGSIAAEGNNGLGVTGVNWRAKIMPLKFLGPNGGYTSDAVEAINYAVAMGAGISNNSWGGGGYSRTLLEAIDRADAAGHLFVAAAGNGGSDRIGDDNDSTPFYPASYGSSNIISVAATDSNDSLASFSNYGSTSVDIAAPGVGILSILPNSSYGKYSGTSMAAPHVSGVAALLKSTNASADDATLKDWILSSAEARSGLSGKTAAGGRLNAADALAKAAPPVEALVAPTITGVRPSSGATGVARNTNVTATFSAAMDPATLTTSTFRLVKSGSTTPIAATVTLSADGQTVKLDPAMNLASRTQYTATIKGGPGGARDLKGSALEADRVWSFKTGRR